MALQDPDITFEYRDEFQRKPIAEKVIRLLKSEVDISPMILDGGWGTGKSEFCHKLVNLIESDDDDNAKIVYVDAFKADHADDPLMTIFAAILNILPESERPSIVKKAIPALKFGAKTLLKGGLNWVLRQDVADVADDFDEELKKVGDDLINQNVERILQTHVEAEQSIETLKSALITIAEQQPVIIVVDELDRCRPNFALSMLESIKHIFNVDGVKFLLVTNTEQLKDSISHCYGTINNAVRYLDKFVNYKFSLPNTYLNRESINVNVSRRLLVDLVESSTALQGSALHNSRSKEGALLFINELVEHEQLALRDIERFVRHLDVLQIVSSGNQFPENIIFGYCLLRLFGVYMFTFYPEQALKLINGNLEANFFNELIRDGKKFTRSQPHETDHKDCVAAMLMLESGDEALSVFDEDAVEAWQQITGNYFNGGNRFGRRVDIVKEVIKALTLN